MGICRFKTSELKPLIEHAKAAAEFDMGYENMTDEECIAAGLPPITNRTPRGPALLFVHDQGVYLMSNGEPRLHTEDGKSNHVIYAEGCNPDIGEFDDWYGMSRELVGGDDFVEILPIHDYWLGDCDVFETFEINATGSSISYGFADTKPKTKVRAPVFSAARVQNFLNRSIADCHLSAATLAAIKRYESDGWIRQPLKTVRDILTADYFKTSVLDELNAKLAEAGITKQHLELANIITELNLSVRCRKCTTKLGINTVYDLTQQTAAELLEIKNFGAVSLAEVREKLAERGLTLKGETLANQRHVVSR